MSLRLKFGILLGLLGLTVLLVGASSWGAFEMVRSEVREPIHSMTNVLQRLGDIKRDVEKLGGIVSGASDGFGAAGFRAPSLFRHRTPTTAQIDEFNRVGSRVATLVNDIRGERETAEEWALRTSKTTLQNINSRLTSARADGLAYLQAAAGVPWREGSDAAPEVDQPARAKLDEMQATAAMGFFEIHELIERTESRLIVDAQAAIPYSDRLRMFLLAVLGSAFAIAGLAVVMGVMLVRRWVLRPVAELREATARIGRGEYAYRIPVEGAGPSDELRRLSVEVNQMAGLVKTMQDDRVEREKLAALGEMVRRLAHNLRNPLGGIRSLAELTIGELPVQGPQADLRENQTRIITAVDRFEKWLNDLLTATRPMRITPEATDVRPWLGGLVDVHRAMAQSRGVALNLDVSGCPGEAVFDSRHLEHAVSAILSNAIEATSSPQARGQVRVGGSVEVRAGGPDPAGKAPSEGYWTLSIADQGPGVPRELQEQVFRPYFTTKPDGNGIGLAVALQVVKAHGGQIRLESPWPSQENGSGAAGGHSGRPAGTRFTIELPMNRPTLTGEDVDMASIGHDGAAGGQNSRHRG